MTDLCYQAKTSSLENSVGIKRRATKHSAVEVSALNVSQHYGKVKVTRSHSVETLDIPLLKRKDILRKSNSTNIPSSSLCSALGMTESASFQRGEGRSRKAATGNLKLSSSVESSVLPLLPPPPVLTMKAVNWHEITFDDDEDGGWLDDDERGFYEGAQFGPPIVLDHHSSRSYVEQMKHHGLK